jgi:hypothetical protein
LEPTGSAKSASDKSSTNSASCAHSHTHEPTLSFTLPCNAHMRTRTRTHAGPRARTPGACRSAADTRVHTPAHRCRNEDAAATPTHALAGLPETATASTRITSAPAHEKGPQIRVARDARTHARLAGLRVGPSFGPYWLQGVLGASPARQGPPHSCSEGTLEMRAACTSRH